MPRWRIQFIFQTASGETRITEETVNAENRDGAKAMAIKIQPSEECIFSVHPESDEQFLNSVRMEALGRAGKSWTPTDEE